MEQYDMGWSRKGSPHIHIPALFFCWKAMKKRGRVGKEERIQKEKEPYVGSFSVFLEYRGWKEALSRHFP